MELFTKDGPKFGERRTSAERSARQRVNYSAERQQKFGVTFAVLRLRRFALIRSHCTL